MWALKYREVKQLLMFSQPVNSRGRMRTQASWFNGYADKTFIVVIPYLSLLWFVMHTQPVVQVSWASSHHEHRAVAIKMRRDPAPGAEPP